MWRNFKLLSFVNHQKKTNVLQAILLTINGRSCFVFKSLTHFRICEKMINAPFLDLHLSISNGFVSSKLFSNRAIGIINFERLSPNFIADTMNWFLN